MELAESVIELNSPPTSPEAIVVASSNACSEIGLAAIPSILKFVMSALISTVFYVLL